MKRLRNYLVAGLVVLLPVVATWQVLVWLFNLIDGLLGGLVTRIFGRSIPGLGLAATVIIVLAVGALAANWFGRRLIDCGERLMRRTPIVRNVYSTIKQIIDAFVGANKTAFRNVVLIEYPRKGVYSPGFATGPTAGELSGKTKEDLVGVFVPTTPNPTSGFLLYVPRRDVIYLDMSVEDGLKLVISGGVVTPPKPSTGGGAAGQ